MNRRLAAACAVVFLLQGVAAAAGNGLGSGAGAAVRIGVLAKRGVARAHEQWGPTAAYLQREVGGGEYRIVPLDFDRLVPAVRDAEVDFVLANSSFYVLLERHYGASRIATLRNRLQTAVGTRFGGVIFSRADDTGIATLAELGGRTLAAVEAGSLGGYQMALRELRAAGIVPRRTVFTGTHDAVVDAVLAGEVAAGTVRTDTLERMAGEGRIDLASVRVLGDLQGAEGFPLHRSTRLYPEWPFAALPHVDEGLRRMVASALLRMPADGAAAAAGRNAGWAVPLNYQPVHELLRELNLPPYEGVGRFTLAALARDHGPTIAAAALALVLLVFYALRTGGLNRALRRSEARARQQALEAERFLNIAGSLIVALDRQARVTLINDRGCEILGLPRAEILGLPWFACFSPPARRAADEALFRRLLGDGGGDKVQGELVDRSGRHHVVSWSLVPLCKDGSGEQVGVLASGLDITQEVAAERALTLSRSSFNNVVQRNRSGILLVDGEGRIRFANPAAELLLGRPGESLLGAAFEVPRLDEDVEREVVRADGAPAVTEMAASRTEWEGAPAFLVMIHDVTERKQAEARVEHLAFHDALTGLPNRNLFRERLQQAIGRARRAGTEIALLFMDLDRFKEVNDTLGHAVGDELLQAVARRLPVCVRGTDTVARMGGDEFTVLLEGLPDTNHLMQVVAKLRACLREPIRIGDREIYATPSIGVSLYPGHGEDVETLLRHADAAMYYAKRTQVDGASIYRPSMAVISEERLDLEQDLRKALERGEFRLHYQVQIRLGDARPIGMEALLRWDHPRRGLVSPEHFMEVLENTGLILPVGLWVVEEACRQLRLWLDRGLAPLPVSVNISPRQLVSEDLPEAVAGALREQRLGPEMLCLELTETAVVQDFQHARQVLGRLRDMGLRLHMDDFGTGYSSLGMLRELPFDVVKVDRSFVSELEAGTAQRSLARAAIAMAHSLDKSAIAEGVETEAQRVLLQSYGCDSAQGWLYGPPLPADQAGDLLQARPGQADGLAAQG